MSTDIKSAPIDTTSAAQLAQNGLRFDFVDDTDIEAFGYWFQAMNRGFLEPRASDESIDHRRRAFGSRRLTGVWDDTGADPKTPIATASSWIADLTLPGARSVPSWAISTITVAPTHRRRGIARNLLESELRTAAALGVPVAILTASEATIYTRFGFAPAAMATNWKIDVQRAKWVGPTPDGRVHLVPAEAVRDEGGFEILERVRLATPGLIYFDGILWDRLFGIKGISDPDQLRVIRYDDAAGTAQGFAVYKVNEDEHAATVDVRFFVAATDDAYAAMWRFFFEMDLVTSVTASLRPIDEPFQWQVSDARAVRKNHEGDHLWTRILDVKSALEARRYSAPGAFVLHVTDALGLSNGIYLLEISTAGIASVRSIEDPEPYDDNHSLALTISDLSAIYLGGVPVSMLVHAGRIRELSPGSALATDAAFRSEVTPWLSIWF